jgi:hypothetical protein
VDIFLGVLRAFLAGVGGWAVSRGYIEQDQVEPLAGATLLIVVAIWSAVNKIRQRQKIEEALYTKPPPIK